MRRVIGVYAFTALVASHGLAADRRIETASETIQASEMLQHIRVLASDEFEGRAPGSKGEELTVSYLIHEFQRMGLQPGNPDGTYIQNVPLVGFQTKARAAIQVGGETLEWKSPEEWVAVSRRESPQLKVENSDVVFVGYGVVAPEYDWDDYKGVDVRGKTIVMLINDPPVASENDPSKLDDGLFKGRAMTYYGRWTYKYEIASEKGAAAAILVHETGPAGYPYQVIVGSWGRENFDIPSADGNTSRVALEAWIPVETAKRLFESCGLDFETLKRAASKKDFQPVPLGATAGFDVENTTRRLESKNVVARLPGSDPRQAREHVVYTAHWDHLGRDETLPGDQIYNGAADNASGVAMLLEIAEACSRIQPGPKRSLLFLVVTAEEKGLLGTRYYAEHPLYPLETTLADINMDVINLWGPTRDLTSVGLGQSTLDDLLERLAKDRGREVGPDAEPEKGMYYRSDHFEFAKVGVPALNAKGGSLYVGKPDDFGQKKRDEYTRNHYHKVSDDVKPDWDLSGAVEDARLLFELGIRVADGDVDPQWKDGSEFKAKREAMLRNVSK